MGAFACGPRCTGATWRCAAGDADRWGRELIFFGNYLCEAACPRLFAATAARRINPATDAAGGASSGPCERVNRQLTGRRILEVAPYGYNLYSIPHESTAFPHATGPDPVAVRHCPGPRAHTFVGRNGQNGPAVRHRTTGLGQLSGEWREGNSSRSPISPNPLPTPRDRRSRARAEDFGGTGAPVQLPGRAHGSSDRDRGHSRAARADRSGIARGRTSQPPIEQAPRRAGALDGAHWSW